MKHTSSVSNIELKKKEQVLIALERELGKLQKQEVENEVRNEHEEVVEGLEERNKRASEKLSQELLFNDT